MPTRIRILNRVVLHIGIPIERLRVELPAAVQLRIRTAVLVIQPRQQRRFVEVDRERLERDAVQAATCAPWHDTVGADEPRQGRVVVTGMVVQQFNSSDAQTVGKVAAF